jgi:RNA polymerase sigma-70 factor (ECF subfamily)
MGVSTAVTLTERPPVALAIEGDIHAREDLARECHRQAFLFALHLTRRHDEAADVAQDAMLRFFASIDRFDPERPVRPWLLRIVRNLVRDRARRARVRRTTPLEAEAGEAVIDPPSCEPDPEAAAERVQLQRLVWRCLEVLSSEQREVLVLRDYHGLSYAEIADTVGIPRGTVMSRLHRARCVLSEEANRRLLMRNSGGDR